MRRSTLLVVLFCFGCSSAKTVPRPISPSAEEITEIHLERTGSPLGDCSAFKVTLHRDGTADYWGDACVIRKGQHRGNFDQYYFDKLAQLIASQGFFEMKDRYPDNGTVILDAVNSVIKVTHSGKQTSIFDNARRGLVELWAIEMLIDATIEKVEWEKRVEGTNKTLKREHVSPTATKAPG